MRKFSFDPKKSIIICYAEIVCPKVDISLKMAVDTGATYTMIPYETAVVAGYTPMYLQKKIELTTGSGIEYVPIIILTKFRAFGIEIQNLEVVCHNLPHESPVDGLLGLNFLKKAKLIIDFSKNIIETP